MGQKLKIIKEFKCNIIWALILSVASIFIYVKFSKTLILSKTFLAPDKAFNFAQLFSAISVFVILLTIAIYQGKLKNKSKLKKRSEFAKSLEFSKNIRKLSQTQISYETVGDVKDISEDELEFCEINVDNENIIELYFVYEKKLDI